MWKGNRMEAFFADYLERLQVLDRDFIATFDDLPDEALDWIPGEAMNSFVILVVHVTASARYWIGDAAMGEPSDRHRSEEFQAQGLSRDALKARFAALEAYTRGAMQRLNVGDFAALRPVQNSAGENYQVTVGYALLHALEHTGLHLGHAQITRQLWQQQ